MTTHNEMDCLFCGPNWSSYNNKAHLIPESLGNKSLIVDRECDKCNKYFSTPENYFVQNHFGSASRLLKSIRGKQGKLPNQTLTKGEGRVQKDGSITLNVHDFKIVQTENGFEVSAVSNLAPVDTKQISVVLAKMALEVVYVTKGDLAFSQKFDDLRCYARSAKVNDFFPFLWKPVNDSISDVRLMHTVLPDGQWLYLAQILVPGALYIFPCDRLSFAALDGIAAAESMNMVAIPNVLERDPIRFEIKAEVPPQGAES